VAIKKSIQCPRCNGAGKIPDFQELRRVRIAKLITMTQIAAAARCSLSFVCDVETGRRNCPPKLIKIYERLLK
jgi:hypothetical protein